MYTGGEPATLDAKTAELLDTYIQKFGFEAIRPQILETLRPAIALITPTKIEEGLELALGQTKIGGLPDLPEGWGWPFYDEKHPFAFVAQINLSGIPEAVRLPDLPQTGILYFFSTYNLVYKDDDWFSHGEFGLTPEYCRVLYFQGDVSRLRRVSAPNRMFIYPASHMQFTRIYTLPHLEEWEEKYGEQEDWDDDTVNKFMEFVYDFQDDQTSMFPGTEYTTQQLLGYGDFFQGLPETTNTRLLFRVSHDYLHLRWRSAIGIIFFLIDPDDLKNRDFSKVEADFQAAN